MHPTGFKKWIIVITVVIASLLEMIDTTVVNVSLTDIMGNLGATLEDVAWVITAYAVANVIILPMTGWLSSKFGRRNYFVFSILLFTVASFFCGNAHSIWELVVFRFIQGIGGGALLSTSQSILFETFKPEERGMATAIFGLGVVIGPTFGPTIGGFITDHYSWPWIFYVNLPLGILAAMLSLTFIKESVDRKVIDRVDWWGIGLLIVGIGALQIVLERGETEDWFDTTYIVILSVVSVFALLIFVWRELSIDYPVVDFRIMKDKSFSFGLVFSFILGFGLFASVFVFPIFCQNLLGFTAQQTGELMIPSGLVTIIVMPLVGNLLKKNFPPQVMAVVGFAIFFLFTQMLSHSTLVSGESDFFLPLLMRGIGMGCLFVPLTAMGLSGLKGKDMAQGVGLNNMIRQLGGSFGVALMTTFIHNRMALHRVNLISHINVYETATQDRLNILSQGFLSRGSTPAAAGQMANAAMEGTVIRQSMLMSYMDCFWIIGIFFLFCIPLILFQKKSKNAIVSMEGVH
ncbi:MAG TPA: DHA2 family efflux MFS transporter permease subunit [Bacteroidia bacterium]|nr:DHA2 family efflux MFS transporter permease subunit [Bacteroidia bacterium]